jgi:hypothetical protein
MALGGWTAGSGASRQTAFRQSGGLTATLQAPAATPLASSYRRESLYDFLFGSGLGVNSFDCCTNCGLGDMTYQQIMEMGNWECQEICTRSGKGGMALIVDCTRCKVDCMCVEEFGPVV